MPIVVFQGQQGSNDPVSSQIGTGLAVPRGIEAIWQYNGLIMNDLSVVDKYRFINIDGLDDADIRDAREDNPADDGETAYDAHYGGRTIAINGRVEAYELNKMRDMQVALRGAFADLVEKSLFVMTGDPRRDHYINVRKLSKLEWSDEQKEQNHFFRDFLITVRASDPRWKRVIPNTYFLYPNLTPNPSFEVDTSGWVAGSPTGWSSTTFARQAETYGEGSWALRNTGTKDNNATARFLVAQVSAPGLAVAPSTQYSMQAKIKIVNPPNAAVGAGFYLEVDWYTSGSVFVSTTTSAANTATSGVQTLNATFTSPSTAAFGIIKVYGRTITALDVVDFWVDDVHFQQGTDASESINVINSGNTPALATVDFVGQLSNVELKNESRVDKSGVAETFKLKAGVTISSGDFYRADSFAKTLRDSTGVNRISNLDTTSTWLKINPGINTIDYSTGKMLSNSAGGAIKIQFSDSFI